MRRLATRLLVFRVGGALEAVERLPACACVLGSVRVWACLAKAEREHHTQHITTAHDHGAAWQVAASLGHAQAEQDRLESKQQVSLALSASTPTEP
jgi:hypothetical protein